MIADHFHFINIAPEISLLPESIQPNSIFKEPDGSDVDGFSISTNVLFEFDREIDPSWVRDEDDIWPVKVEIHFTY